MRNLLKYFFPAFLGLFLFFAVFQNAQAVNLREKLLFSVVQISAVDEKGDAFIGSGTTISADGLVLTNYHVVAHTETDELYPDISICYTFSQFKLPRCGANAKVIALNKDYDLALIAPDKKLDKDGRPTKISFQRAWRLEGKKFYAVPFYNSKKQAPADILDPITVWGYPGVGGATITVTSGFVSGFDLIEDKEDTIVKFVKTDTAINPGNSGGAAFNKYYSFIGVPSNAWPGQLGFIIPVQTVVEWLKDLEKEGLVKTKKIDSLKSLKISFSDIDQYDSLNPIAALLKHLKIMDGFPDGTFQPDKEMTRDEFLAVYNKAFPARSPLNLPQKGITRRQAAEYIFDLLAP